MISEELLSEVLSLPISQEPIIENMKSNSIEYYVDEYNNDYPKYINIYELMHKCKEWASSLDSNEYWLQSWIEQSPTLAVCEVDYQSDNKGFTANTEPDVVFKACEWIMNKEKNNG